MDVEVGQRLGGDQVVDEPPQQRRARPGAKVAAMNSSEL
jgi:hypothetical protein